MSSKNKEYLKGRFANGCVPDETDFEDLLDSGVNKQDDVDATIPATAQAGHVPSSGAVKEYVGRVAPTKDELTQLSTQVSQLNSNLDSVEKNVNGDEVQYSGDAGSTNAFWFEYTIDSSKKYVVTNLANGPIAFRVKNGSSIVFSQNIPLGETCEIEGVAGNTIGGWVSANVNKLYFSIKTKDGALKDISRVLTMVEEESTRAKSKENSILEEIKNGRRITTSVSGDMEEGCVTQNGHITTPSTYQLTSIPIKLQKGAKIKLNAICASSVYAISTSPFSTKVNTSTITGDVRLTGKAVGVDGTNEKQYEYTNTSNGVEYVVLCGKNFNGSYTIEETALNVIAEEKDIAKKTLVLTPSFGANFGVNKPYSNNEKFFGTYLYNSILNGVVGIKNYVTWAREAGMRTLVLLVPSSSSQNTEDFKIFNELVYEANQQNIDVCATIYQLPKFSSAQDGTSAIALQTWYDRLVGIASYNGVNAKKDTSNNDVYPKVQYFRVGDELAVEYTSFHYTPLECLKIQSLANAIIKKENPQAKVLSITANRYVEAYHSIFLTSSLTYTEQYADGKSVSVTNEKYEDNHDIELVDFYNWPERLIDTDHDAPESYLKGILLMYKKYEEIAPNVLKLPVWFCSGNTSYEITDEEVSNRYIRMAILSSYFGAERYIAYRMFHCGGSFKPSTEDQYYGLMHPSVANSYVSLFLNNESSTPLTGGGAAKRVYIGFPTWADTWYPGYVHYKINYSYHANSLANLGLKISGKGYTIVKVELCDGCTTTANVVNTLYNGDAVRINNADDSLVIDKSKFAGYAAAGQYIKVYYSNADKSLVATKDPLPAYNKIAKLSSILNGERPSIRSVGELVYTASWVDANKTPWYAIWKKSSYNSSAQYVSIEIEGSFYNVYNSLLEVQSDIDLSNVGITTDVIYINKATNVKIVLK